jgi:hypothetical protein
MILFGTISTERNKMRKPRMIACMTTKGKTLMMSENKGEFRMSGGIR